MGGTGQSQRDYLGMGYKYKIKGHIEWPSLKDTKGNIYWSDSFWKKITNEMKYCLGKQ